MNFYNKLLKLCSSHTKERVSPSAVAEKIGLSRASASGWKKGAVPSDANLQKVADYFGVPVDYFKKEELPDKAEQSELSEREENINRLLALTDEEWEKVDAFVQGLLANR